MRAEELGARSCFKSKDTTTNGCDSFARWLPAQLQALELVEKG